MTLPDRLRFTDLELTWGVPIGTDEGTPALDAPSPYRSAREALEAVTLEAVRRPPCVVSFSGGVDSSCVLAIATHVARREELPMPIPVTNVFPGEPASDESEWQRSVIDHLGLSEWTRLTWTDELDVVGPLAQRVLRRHGVMSPANSHFHEPIFELAAGGALLSGIGGDELFAAVHRHALNRWRYADLPRRKLYRAIAQTAPAPVRAAASAIRLGVDLPWLRPGAARRIRWQFSRWLAAEPVQYDEALRAYWWRSRDHQMSLASKHAMATAHRVTDIHPLAHPEAIRAVAAEVGPRSPSSRAAVIHPVVADLLPTAVLDRSSKASFNRAFWTQRATEFSRTADLSPLNSRLIDVEALHRHWREDAVDSGSYSLLQTVWLANHPTDSDVDEPVQPR